MLSQSQVEIFFSRALDFLTKQKFELNEQGQQERELTTNQVGPAIKSFTQNLLTNQLIVRYDGHLPARPLMKYGMTFLPDAQVTLHTQKLLAVEVKIIREIDPSGSLSKAIGQTQMYRALGFESAIGLIFDLRKSRHHSLSNTLQSLERDQRTKFLLFS